MSTVKVSGSPPRATHYAIRPDGSINWYKLGIKWKFWHNGDWHSLVSEEPLHAVMPIPLDQMSSASDQLPAIGSSCEFWIANGRWDPCRVVAHDVLDGVPVAVVAYAGGYYGASIKTLRVLQEKQS